MSPIWTPELGTAGTTLIVLAEIDGKCFSRIDELRSVKTDVPKPGKTEFGYLN